MNPKLVIPAAATAIVAALTLAGCSHSSGTSAQQQENQQQQQDTSSLINDQPIPHFNYSQIRQTLIDAETISANGTQTTSFFFQLGDQDPVFSCPSLGVPVANTAQLSNPDQNYNSSYPNDGTSYPIPQMDPNGIYAPSASSGTYVICVNSSGQKYLQYWEGDVMTVTSAATWDSTTHTLKVIGAPTAVIHTASGK
jgi:hypothetical protein